MITLREAGQQALESLRGYRRELGCSQPCDAERALEIALEQPAHELAAAAQQTLKALEYINEHGFVLADYEDPITQAITALRDALAQEDEMREMLRTLGFGSQCPESIGITLRRWRDGYAAALAQEEPVAWRAQNATPPGGFVIFQQYPQALADLGGEIEPLYTHPPRREWRNLTMQEINALPEIGGVMWRMGTAPAVLRAIRAVERALKEKNA
jgi:hypothetical protein